MRLPVLLGGLLIFALSASGNAEVITRCEAPEGYAYFAPGGAVPRDKAGWQQDRTSAGSYLLLKDSRGFDLIFTDATRRTISSRDDGGQVLRVTETPGTVVVVINYPQTLLETWTFKLNERGTGFVVFTQSRYGDDVLIQKYSVMRGVCSK
jgi:hypothetical protein